MLTIQVFCPYLRYRAKQQRGQGGLFGWMNVTAAVEEDVRRGDWIKKMCKRDKEQVQELQG